jgi:hypothetical protein
MNQPIHNPIAGPEVDLPAEIMPLGLRGPPCNLGIAFERSGIRTSSNRGIKYCPWSKQRSP